MATMTIVDGFKDINNPCDLKNLPDLKNPKNSRNINNSGNPKSIKSSKSSKSLRERIGSCEFRPEVYSYPPPRMYTPIMAPSMDAKGFSLRDVEFTNPLNVYVHIPFCRQICSFCGYFKTIDQGDQAGSHAREAYVDAVEKEIGLYAHVLRERAISTLHVGGGTPSLLTPLQLERIIEAFRKANPNLLSTAEEISIEATPESVELAKFSAFAQAGINRVSIGIQSLDAQEIAASGRKNDPSTSLKAIETLRAAGIGNVVADVMIGIDNQSVESFGRTLRTLIGYAPDTVELYALGLMPSTRAWRTSPELRMSEQDTYRCYALGRELFLAAGYVQDCHNRYALAGKGSFLQEDYVFEGMSLLGFGAGARSYATNMHYRNTSGKDARSAIRSYQEAMSQGKLAIASAVMLDQDERMRKYAIGHIESLDKTEFKSRFKTSFSDAFPALYQELLARDLGLAQESAERIELTAKGLDFRDLIAWELFSPTVWEAEEKYRSTAEMRR